MSILRCITKNRFDALLRRIALAAILWAALTPAAHADLITAPDIAMAKRIIEQNTRTLPGFGVGSQVKVSTGDFSSSDAMVLYMLKFHQQFKICPPLAVVAEALKKLNDSELHKKAVAIFWKDYSTCTDLNDIPQQPDFLHDNFEWYILTKQTERLKISNAKLQGFVGSEETWRRVMNDQQKFWEKSKNRENEFILTRDANRVIFDAQAAVAASERAVAGGY